MTQWYFGKACRHISNNWGTSWRYSKMFESLSNLKKGNSSQIYQLPGSCHFPGTTGSFTTHHRNDVRLEAPNQYFRTMAVPGILQRLLTSFANYRPYFRAFEQRVAKWSTNALGEARQRWPVGPTSIARRTNQATSISFSEIHIYKHFGHQCLLLPSWLRSPTAKATRTRQTDWVLLKIPHRRRTRLQLHAKKFYRWGLARIITEKVFGRRLIHHPWC